MSEPVTKAIELADKWGSTMVDAMAKYGPDAVQLGMTVARLDALMVLVKGAAGFLIFGLIAWKCKSAVLSHVADVRARNKGTFDILEAEPLIIMVGGFAMLAFTLGAVAAGSELLNVMAWVGVAEPRVWLAAKLLKLT